MWNLIDKALESSQNALPEEFSEFELIKETVDQVSVFFGKENIENYFRARIYRSWCKTEFWH